MLTPRSLLILHRPVGFFIQTFLHVSFKDIAAFELATAEPAGVRGGYAALVSLMAHERSLVQVGAFAAHARVLVGHGVASRVVLAEVLVQRKE